MSGYTFMGFHFSTKRNNHCDPVCFPGCQKLIQKGVYSQRKEFYPERSKFFFFFLENGPSFRREVRRGAIMKIIELPPMEVYQFTVMDMSA